MCSTGPHFKLCTCSNIERLQDYWVLTTGNTHVLNGLVGTIMPPPGINEATYFDLDSFVTKRLLHDLNSKNIFDFDYTPQEGDKIRFVFEELKPDDLEEHEDYSIEVVFDGEKFGFPELGSDYEGGEELKSGEICLVPYPSNT